MEDFAEKASIKINLAEKDILTSIALQEPIYTVVERQLHKFREACQDFIFLDVQAAATTNVETRLWDAHGKVNRKFRSLLSGFRDAKHNRKLVEQRKAEKLYLDFIKSSIRFYRNYIQRLASHFKDVPEIFEIARRVNLSAQPTNASVSAGVEDKATILRSCHSTLIQLGDLWRYKETELKTNERNWTPAKAYYDLAAILDPNSGISFNQFAVIALADKDHLCAVYYLYRALCVEKPAPQASNNIELEFKKIRSRNAQGQLFDNKGPENSTNDLISRFVHFHALRNTGALDAGHEDLQSEILQRLADELRERSSDATTRKICLINIAAEHCAANVVRETTKHLSTFKVFQSFNVATFFVLLKLLLDELQPPSKDQRHEQDLGAVADTTKRITPITLRILPLLRIYSAWLVTNVRFFIAQQGRPLDIHVNALWQVYAEAMTLLVSSYSLRNLPDLQYLLDEDEDTIAFSPFSGELKELHFHDSNGTIKPRGSDLMAKERKLENETPYRIRAFVKDALFLCRNRNSEKFGAKAIPLQFGGGRFVYHEDEEDCQMQNSPVNKSRHGHTSSTDSISREDIEEAKRSGASGFAKRSITNRGGTSEAGVSASANSTMENMVNDLVRSEVSEPVTVGDPLTPILKMPDLLNMPHQTSAQLQQKLMTGRDSLHVSQNSPNVGLIHTARQLTQRASLPSIWNTPFAPRPGETPGSSPRLPIMQDSSNLTTASHLRSSSSFSNVENMPVQPKLQPATSAWQSSPPRTLSDQDISYPYERLPLQTTPSQNLSLSAYDPQGRRSGHTTRTPSFGAIGEHRPSSRHNPTNQNTG